MAMAKSTTMGCTGWPMMRRRDCTPGHCRVAIDRFGPASRAGGRLRLGQTKPAPKASNMGILRAVAKPLVLAGIVTAVYVGISRRRQAQKAAVKVVRKSPARGKASAVAKQAPVRKPRRRVVA